MPDRPSRIYSATYSNVPVYEFSVGSNHVMRRRSDDWINATHILKVADYDKPARTRILEREVQKGIHEKVQGGYGKYQGTWVPLPEGRLLAERNGIFEKLAPIFEFIPGDRSPPPAPKHATAASSKPRAPRAPTQPRKTAVPQRPQKRDASYDDYSVQQNDETPDNGSVVSESDDENVRASQYSTGSRKRKREAAMSYEDQLHVMWSDDLLDYFMLLDSEDASPSPPVPDASINLNRPIDDKGHTAMHWAAAMGDLNVVKDLMKRGARIDTVSNNGETPLIRSILFTNNYDKQTFGKLVHVLIPTIASADWFGSTVFHHIAMTTKSKSKYSCARYYLDTLMDKVGEMWQPQQLTRLLNKQDQHGDTAIILAARHGARKCVRSLMAKDAATDIPNAKNETADELIHALNTRRRDRYRPTSSSPFQQPNGSATYPGALPHQTSSSSTHLPLFPPGSQPHDSAPASFRSEAAHLLSSQLPHLITTRASALASALEQELVDRDAESREAEHLLAARRQELAHLRRANAALAAREADTHRLLELEQAAELADLVRAEEAHATTLLSPPAKPAADNAAVERLALAAKLSAAQAQRRALVADVVAAQSRAGMSDRQGLYKRLITGALGVAADDVEALLPEMLADLEEAAGGAMGDGDAMDVDGGVKTPTRGMAGDSGLGMGRVPDAVGVVG